MFFNFPYFFLFRRVWTSLCRWSARWWACPISRSDRPAVVVGVALQVAPAERRRQPMAHPHPKRSYVPGPSLLVNTACPSPLTCCLVPCLFTPRYLWLTASCPHPPALPTFQLRYAHFDSLIVVCNVHVSVSCMLDMNVSHARNMISLKNVGSGQGIENMLWLCDLKPKAESRKVQLHYKLWLTLTTFIVIGQL